MNFGSRLLKLSNALVLLVSFPFLLTIIFTGAFLWTEFEVVRHHLVLIACLSFLSLGHVLVSIFFAKKLSREISLVVRESQELADGNFAVQVNTATLPETTTITHAINLLKGDINQQAKFAGELKGGNLDATYVPRHERDILGNALLQIRDNLVEIKKEDEQRNWASGGLAKFVEVLQSAKDLKALSNDIIVNLVKVIQANQGTIFILAKDGAGEEFLEMQACYAYNRTKHFSQKIALGEGLIGQAFLENETIYLKEVPDRFVRITSGLGEANPRFILIVPLKMNETTVGIVELASFREFGKHEVAFVEKIGESIAYTVSSMRVADHTRKIVDELNEQAEQMRAQEEELRQNQEELQATQETISRKYDALFKKLGELNHQSRFDQLKSITSTKKRNIEYYFDIIRSQILTFSEDRMIIEATKAFTSAFYKMGTGIPEQQLRQMQESVTGYYSSEFIPRLNDNINRGSDLNGYVPTDPRAVALQYLYISGNPHPTGKKSNLDDARDGSEYSSVHALYHPVLRNFLEKFGYYDIFLIDAVTGDMVYSVFKEVDFATSLVNGPYGTTNFGRVVQQAMKSTGKEFVKLIDFEPYDPSYHAPASFIACPVYDGNEKKGILVFQMPINKINQILTGNNKWREDGLGESGETFIVGQDYKLRSISRELIEDADAHLLALKKLKYDEDVIQQIKKMETNILLEEVRQDSVTKAFNGITGTQLETSRFGFDMLCAFAPLDIPDVRWIVMSTLKEEEASMRINNLREGNFDT